MDFLPDELYESYATTDFDLAAFMMCYPSETDGKPFIKVTQITPIPQPSRKDSTHHRYLFHLAGRNGQPMTRELRIIELRYTNAELKVEPLTLMAARRQLRAFMERHSIDSLSRKNATRSRI